MDVVNRTERDAQWQNVEFIPHPTTYLRGERWNDDVIEIGSAPAKKEKFDSAKWLVDEVRKDYDKRENTETVFDAANYLSKKMDR